MGEKDCFKILGSGYGIVLEKICAKDKHIFRVEHIFLEKTDNFDIYKIRSETGVKFVECELEGLIDTIFLWIDIDTIKDELVLNALEQYKKENKEKEPQWMKLAKIYEAGGKVYEVGEKIYEIGGKIDERN